MTAGAALGFGIRDIRGVTIDVQKHVAGIIVDGCIRI